MSGGHNRKFMADPAGYAANKTILVPCEDQMGFWSKEQPGPFDLTEVSGSGFTGTVLVLNTMNRRAKATDGSTRGIPGAWIPYEVDKCVTKAVNATVSPYFVFTSKLGGCGLGIRDLNNAQTAFTHDATGNQANNLGGCAVALPGNSYDPTDSGINLTAFFWWNGTKWQLGRSATYNAHGLSQSLGGVADKYPKKMGAP